MKEFKGTPGPWATAKFASLVVRNETENTTICSTGNDAQMPMEVAQANAKLIAAAPELLEALQAALVELEMFIPVTNVSVLDKAQAAINKALS